MNTYRPIFLLIIAAVLTMLSGCAKYPSTPVSSGKQLVLTMKVRGTISPTDSVDPSIHRYYFIAIDNDGKTGTGPWAAVAAPYGGNGWVTSADAANSVGLTSYIRYDAQNPEGYLYGVLSGSYFLNTTAPQAPIRYELLDGGSTIRFIIDFSQIATTAIPTDDIQELNINFITTNSLPVSDQQAEGRIWDGLGYSGQDYATIYTTSDNTQSGDNSGGHPVSDPDLDIVYWSVEVQTVSNQ